MRIQSSHLCLRFYEHDGWTEDILRECLISGDIEFCPGFALNYWRLKIGGAFSPKKLLEYATKVDRWYEGEPKESDEQYIRSMNC